MAHVRKMIVLVVSAVIPLVSACSQNKPQVSNQDKNLAWSTSFDSLGSQFQQIRQAYMQDSTRMSPQARMMYHNIQSLWSQMSGMRSGMMQNGGKRKGRGMMGNQGMMNGRGMMGGNGMMGQGSMMRFNEMNQQMYSYCQGMQQIMHQAGNTNMAGIYGQMANKMKSFISELPEDTTSSAPVTTEGSAAVPDGSVIFASNCTGCHGTNGQGMSGVFPPLNGSSVAAGDKGTLTRIILNGLQGQVTVAGSHYNGMMPAFGSTLSDAQIAAVLSYVRLLPDNKAGSVTATEVHNVRKETSSQHQAWTPDELGLK